MSEPTEAQQRRADLVLDYEAWLLKEYSIPMTSKWAACIRLPPDRYLWMKDAYGAGDEHGAARMRAAVLDLIKNQRLYQSLYKQIEELN